MTNKKKILDRLFKRMLLTDSEWDELYKDFQDGETKAIICAKWKISNSEYKALKDYIYGGQ